MKPNKTGRTHVRAHATLAERILPRIKVVVDDVDRCWDWQGYRNWKGYGQVASEKGRLELAHRAMWRLTWGTDIPPGKHVLHVCDRPICCRPSHLWLGTNAENHRDKMAKGRGHQAKGERHSKAKLTEAQILEIRASSATQRALARQYGVTHQAIYEIVHRINWTHI